jgi:hypothetical protein
MIYNLPKWFARITLDENEDGVHSVLYNAATGEPEFTIKARNLASSAKKSGEQAANLIIANPNGGPTHPRMRMNLQKAAETSGADAATIEPGEGVADDKGDDCRGRCPRVSGDQSLSYDMCTGRRGVCSGARAFEKPIWRKRK